MARVRQPQRFDAVVVGAGSAGAAAALWLARGGLKVALLEKRRLAQAGARWINAVPAWLLRRAGWWPLEAGESQGGPAAFWVCASSGWPRLRIERPDLDAVRVGALVDRLHRLAGQAGVRMWEGTRIKELVMQGGRPVRLELSRPALSLSAALFVDASGAQTALGARVPALGCLPFAQEDICLAAQGLFSVVDRRAAGEYCRRFGFAPGESFSRNGVEGAYSTLTLRLSAELDEVELLAGAIAGPGRKSGARLLEDFRRRLGFVGERMIGGAGAIPLRPRRRLWAPGIALVGDSAGQVFAAHGSGTGAGLLAARLLAESCSASDDPGGQKALERYRHAWEREMAPALLAADAFRRQLCRQESDMVRLLLEAGAPLTPLWRGALEQRFLWPSPRQTAAAAFALWRRPRDVLRLAAFVGGVMRNWLAGSGGR